MCGVCTTKGLYEMNSMSEYPYEDKIHSDDKVNYKTVYSSDRIWCVSLFITIFFGSVTPSLSAYDSTLFFRTGLASFINQCSYNFSTN